MGGIQSAFASNPFEISLPSADNKEHKLSVTQPENEIQRIVVTGDIALATTFSGDRALLSVTSDGHSISVVGNNNAISVYGQGIRLRIEGEGNSVTVRGGQAQIFTNSVVSLTVVITTAPDPEYVIFGGHVWAESHLFRLTAPGCPVAYQFGELRNVDEGMSNFRIVWRNYVVTPEAGGNMDGSKPSGDGDLNRHASNANESGGEGNLNLGCLGNITDGGNVGGGQRQESYPRETRDGDDNSRIQDGAPTVQILKRKAHTDLVSLRKMMRF